MLEPCDPNPLRSNAPGSAPSLEHIGAWLSVSVRSWRVPTKPLVSTLSSPRRSVSPPYGRILTGSVHFARHPLAKPARTSRIRSVVNKDKPTKMTFQLLSTGNPKVLKGQTQGYMTFILHLAPYTLSGHNTCPKATPGCAMACLNTAGRGGMFRKGENTNVIQKARIRKTQWFYADRDSFMATLVSDIQKAIRYAEKRGYLPVFRLNGTSDLSWEKYSVIRDGVQYKHIFDAFSGVQFYDYTKVLGRKVKDIWNYHLTFSKAESNDFDTRLALSNGMNVAVVFSTKKNLPLPATYLNRTVFNGDESDLRFLDPQGVVVGLYAKGRAKRDTSGFVVQV